MSDSILDAIDEVEEYQEHEMYSDQSEEIKAEIERWKQASRRLAGIVMMGDIHAADHLPNPWE